MTIEEMRTRKIELGFTNEMLSRASGVPLSTVQKIMGGLTKAPRKLTVDALRKVLEAADTGQDNMSGQRRYSYTSQSYDSGLKPAASMMCEPAMNYGDTDQSGQTADKACEPVGNYTEAEKIRKYTLDDYYALPDDQRVELIDGVFYDMSAPSAIHQIILGDLYILFRECADRHGMPCHVFLSPFDVRLDRDNYTMVQPDLVIFCHDFDIDMKRYEGAPDLAVEILSPSTRRKDLTLKLFKYEQAGVREYWVVDPKVRKVTVHCFEKEDYHPVQYDFSDQIPIGISNGECVIDFSRVKV